MTRARLSRALSRPPRYLVARALESARRRTRRGWAYLYPRLVTERALLAAFGSRDLDQLWAELSHEPFFISSAERRSIAKRFETDYPDAREVIIRAADAVVQHEFDLLGSGPQVLGARLPWLADFKSGREWPLVYCGDIQYGELDRPSDVKVPWELSRCQHFTRLGQAYWMTDDERYAAEFVAETTDWMEANPFARGVNWACAMDVALRAVSWIWGFHFFADSDACRDRRFRGQFLRALFLHGEFIAKFLEKADLNGNHYLCDGVGLVFLGCLFRRSRLGAGWLALGRAVVEDEILKQTTPDGVDFEQSTAYHRLVLEAFMTSYELLRRHGDRVPTPCWDRLERMCEFVQAYTKPDGLAPLVGDADDGRIQILGSQRMTDHRYLLSSAAILFDNGAFKSSATRCWEETFWLCGADAPERFRGLAAQPAPGSTAFPDGGFYVLRGRDSHLFIDCAEVGFGGRGGHGHNDILSFELFLHGFNVITDCGAYAYTGAREWRNRFRSTAFHSVVQVDGEELNRFVGPHALWQLQYDARPTAADLLVDSRADSFRGGHTGYARLPSPLAHTRTCMLDKCLPRVLVQDRIESIGEHTLVWRFHLDPAVTHEIHGPNVRLTSAGQTVWLMPDETAASFAFAVEPGWVSASYGVKTPTAVLVWTARVPGSIEASYLFAEALLTPDDRRAVSTGLRTASAGLKGS